MENLQEYEYDIDYIDKRWIWFYNKMTKVTLN